MLMEVYVITWMCLALSFLSGISANSPPWKRMDLRGGFEGKL